MTELQAALGSTLPAGTAQLTLFVPGTNRSGEPIDQTYWVGQALACLGRLFRGATAFPPAEGVWRDDSAGGELLFESTRMVLSYADPDLLDESEVLGELRRFLHRMGSGGAAR